jgi:hypothetical protein
MLQKLNMKTKNTEFPPIKHAITALNSISPKSNLKISENRPLIID